MKIKVCGAFIVGCFVFLFGCKSAPQSQSTQQPDANSAIVSVKRDKQFFGSANAYKVFIDGSETTTIKNGQEARFQAPNGTHTIQIKPAIPLMLSSKRLTFTAASNVIAFEAKTGIIGITLAPTASSASSVIESTERTRSTETDGIEGAVNRAIKALIEDLPANTAIAVLSLASSNEELAVFIMDEIEFQFVDTGNFTVVDRKTLDQIRSEQNFQASGEVDDTSAISIGKLLGANIVITGSMTGSKSTQRLTLKALNVQSAQIMAMAREQF
jgi:TolB-like protein